MRVFAIFLLLSLAGVVRAQAPYVPLNNDYYQLLDRYEILSGKNSPSFHSTIKPFDRESIAAFLDSLEGNINQSKLSKADSFNLAYLSIDNREFNDDVRAVSRKPVLKHFYRYRNDFYAVNTKDLDLHINPVIHWQYGRESGTDLNPFINTRGIEVRGMIDNKVGFYTYAADNQAIFPEWTREYIEKTGVVPSEGYTKPFKTNGVDFLTARGYITFNIIPHIQAQFGYGNHFIGNGYRSLILSDFSGNYSFLKLNTRVWKFNYMNLFTRLTADVFYLNDLLPHKYMAMHHLSLNIGKNLNVGVFESVVFARDSMGGAFDVTYLNPVIFYRSVEQQLGSEDNALLGIDFRWLILKKFSLYGQFVLDEFLLSHLRERNGWWGNKQAGQIGLKYVNAAGVRNLDLQAEMNVIRPYTYTHETKFKSYTHYNHPLAHPLGANLYEYIGIVRYQPISRLTLTGKIFHIKYGADTTGVNWGGDVLKDYRTREREFNNEIAQGVRTTINYISFAASWQLRHNLFIDLKQIIRRESTEGVLEANNTNVTLLGFRWNIPQRLQEF